MLLFYPALSGDLTSETAPRFDREAAAEEEEEEYPDRLICASGRSCKAMSQVSDHSFCVHQPHKEEFSCKAGKGVLGRERMINRRRFTWIFELRFHELLVDVDNET